MMTAKKGFTLVELLLAISISAIIALGTVTLVNSTINTRNALASQAEASSQLTRAMRKIEQDLIQISPFRPVRDPYGDYLPPVELNFEGLYFTRLGWGNSPLMSYERSSLQRLHYRLAEPGSELCPLLDNDEDNDLGGCLIRGYTAHLDNDGSLTWQYQRILRPVKQIEWDFLVHNPQDGSTEFRSEPPGPDPTTGVTVERLLGINMNIVMGTGQSYERIFRTPSLPPAVQPTGGNS